MKPRIWYALPLAGVLFFAAWLTPIGVTRGHASSTAAELAPLHLSNYYPANEGWWYMWTNWNPQIIDSNFAELATIHVNAVRIDIFPQVFGYPQPTTTMMQHLNDLLNMAQAHSLRVMLTFFDFWNDYSDIAGSRQWLGALLANLMNDPRIIAVDLQNEMPNSNPQAIAWAQNLIPYLHTLVGSIAVTISVSGADGGAGLQRLINAGLSLDFFDVHYYGGPALMYLWASQILKIAGSTPVFVGETGYSTNTTNDPVGNLILNKQQEESYQSQYFRTIDYALHSLGLPYAGCWVYSDFYPNAIPPDGPSQNPLEYWYGLVRSNGTWKPAARAMAYTFGGGPVDTAFNNSFEYGDPGGMPLLWRIWQPNAPQFARDTSVFHSGTASGRISNSANQANYPGFFTTPVKYIEPGKSYSATVWARGANATGTNQLAIVWFDSAGNYLGKVASSPLPAGTTSWTLLSLQSVAPATAAYIQIHLESSGNSGSVWFDDVTFE